MSKSVEGGAAGSILVTMGEPAGIGPEIAVKAYHHLGGRIRGRPLRLVGDPQVFRSCGAVPANAILATSSRASRTPGNPQQANAAGVCEAISLAVRTAMRGEAAAVVTAPINKAVLAQTDFPYRGHTEFLAKLTGAHRAVMMLSGPGLRVVPLTVHIPLARVAQAITRKEIEETSKIILSSLVKDFAVGKPRLAIAGLNPHAGDNGVFGDEEARIISPAIESLRRDGADVIGPLSADTMFHEEARSQYDAALCMYHDQALLPLKALYFWSGVNITLGLPIVRTSPDHGTAFDIAGTGKANASSMVAAIEMAAEIADARKH